MPQQSVLQQVAADVPPPAAATGVAAIAAEAGNGMDDLIRLLHRSPPLSSAADPQTAPAASWNAAFPAAADAGDSCDDLMQLVNGGPLEAHADGGAAAAPAAPLAVPVSTGAAENEPAALPAAATAGDVAAAGSGVAAELELLEPGVDSPQRFGSSPHGDWDLSPAAGDCFSYPLGELQQELAGEELLHHSAAAAILSEYEALHTPQQQPLLVAEDGRDDSSSDISTALLEECRGLDSALAPCTRQLTDLADQARSLRHKVLALCAGMYGADSVRAAQQLLKFVETHNSSARNHSRPEQVVDLMALKEDWFLERPLLTLLVSKVRVWGPAGDQYPAEELPGDQRLGLLQELKRCVAVSAPAAAASAVAAPTMGVSSASGSVADGMSSMAAAAAAGQLVTTRGGFAGGSSCNSTVAATSSSSAGAFGRLLQCTNRNKATPWFTACHFSDPVALQFLLDQREVAWQVMLKPTKRGRSGWSCFGSEAVCCLRTAVQ